MEGKSVFGFLLISSLLFQAILAKPAPQYVMQQSSSDALAAANSNSETLISGHHPYGGGIGYPSVPIQPYYPQPQYPSYPVYPGYPGVIGNGYSNAEASAQASAQSSALNGVGGGSLYPSLY